MLYSTFLEKSARISRRGLSPEEMLRSFLRYLKNENKYVLITLDEIDYLIKKEKEKGEESTVVYDLTRIYEVLPKEARRVLEE